MPPLVEVTSFDHPDAAKLRERKRENVRADFGDIALEPGPAPTAQDVPYFLLVRVQGQAVACGGLKFLSESTAELKQMFVEPPYRRKSYQFDLAALLLERLLAEAKQQGCNKITLDTGITMLPARRFYERNGFALQPKVGYHEGVAVSVQYIKFIT